MSCEGIFMPLLSCASFDGVAGEVCCAKLSAEARESTVSKVFMAIPTGFNLTNPTSGEIVSAAWNAEGNVTAVISDNEAKPLNHRGHRGTRRTIGQGLGGGPHAHFGEDFAGGFGTGADTVRYADAGEAVAREGEAGKLLAEGLNPREPFEMANRILRHGGLPFIDACEERLSVERDDLAQFV